jgi:hypothetical protein
MEIGHFSRSAAAGGRCFLREPCKGRQNFSPGPARGRSPACRPGSAFQPISSPLPPNHEPFGDSGGEDGRGGHSSPNPKSCVSLLFQHLSERSVSRSSGLFVAPSLCPLPQPRSWVGGEGRNSWEPRPRAAASGDGGPELLPPAAPWARIPRP